MAKIRFKSVDDYIATQPRHVQPVLERVWSIIRKALPGSDEMISYQIPTYKLQGRTVIYFAGWSQHYALYPSSDRLVETFKNELSGYEISKGTIRFPLSEPVPARLIEGIVKFRAAEVAGLEKAKRAVRKRR